MIITDKAQIKAASLKESDKLRLTTSDELECYEFIESDLKLPANATFTRSSVAYLSNGTQVPANTPRFEQGKFGKAILVEEGTTNLCQYPTDFSQSAWAASNVTKQPNSGIAPDGSTTMCKIIETTANAVHEIRTPSMTTTSGAYYTFSVIAKAGERRYIRVGLTVTQFGASLYIVVDLLNGSIVYIAGSPYSYGVRSLGNGFYLIYITHQASASASGTQYIGTQPDATTITYAGNGSSGLYIWHPQIEAKPYATSFINGTRSAETLTIPTAGVLNPQEGTIEFRLKPLIVINYNNFFSMGLSNGRFLLFFNSSGFARFDYGPPNTGPEAPNGTIIANNWYHIALRWSATTGKQALFINGVKYEYNLPNGVATSFPSTVSVVNNYSAYIDDLRISNKARSDEEILAAYQNNLPLLADKWTTYKLDFDDKVRITTQGQIICNELIEI